MGFTKRFQWHLLVIFFVLFMSTTNGFAGDAGLEVDTDGKVTINSVLNLKPQSSPPLNPTDGDIFYNDTKELLLFNDGKWGSVIIHDIDWFMGNWGTCSDSCGGGTQTRSSTCQRSDGQVMSDDYCESDPVTTQACNIQACVYAWDTSAYGSCSKTCGGGTQTRTSVCRRTDGLQVADSYCGTKPALSRSCNTQSCYTYAWYTGSYNTCSGAQCNQIGTQSRVVYCKRNDGTLVAGSYCSGTMPVSSRSCTVTSGSACR